MDGVLMRSCAVYSETEQSKLPLPVEVHARMRASFRLTLAAFAAVVSLTLLSARGPVLAASNPQAPAAPPAGSPPPHYNFPAPTNLQVLPKTMTGEEVHAIMEKWEGELGSGCRTCHAVDTKNVGPNGRPRLNFADDSKEEKRTARMMYRMTDKINTDYISMIPNSDQGVSCGTCHRGHLGPEAFVPPARHEDHDHPPAPPAGAPAPAAGR